MTHATMDEMRRIIEEMPDEPTLDELRHMIRTGLALDIHPTHPVGAFLHSDELDHKLLLMAAAFQYHGTALWEYDAREGISDSPILAERMPAWAMNEQELVDRWHEIHDAEADAA